MVAKILAATTAIFLSLCLPTQVLASDSAETALRLYLEVASRIAAPNLELSRVHKRRAEARLQSMWPGKAIPMKDFWFLKENAGESYEVTAITLIDDHAEVSVLFHRDPSGLVASAPAPITSHAGQYTLVREGSRWVILAFKEIEPPETNRSHIGQSDNASSVTSGPGAISFQSFVNDSLAYVANLETCSASTYSYPHPLIPDFIGRNVIKGSDGDVCLIDMFMPNDLVMKCKASKRTVELMQNEQKRMLKGLQDSGQYQISIQINLDSGMTSSDLSNAMNRDCKW